MKLLKTILLISALALAASTARLYAQTYPVQVSTQIKPPYSPYLSDYSAVGAERFMVNFVLKDPTLPEYRCKLRLTIEGVGITIRTKQSFVPQPLVLPGGGIPLQLYGEELEEYFNPNNLDFAGFSKAQYTKGAKLPDGVYRFTVEVLDYNRGTLVSNKGTTVAFIILNDPPLLNMPRTDTKVRIVDPTNIPFTWTPRHTGSPNAAFTTEYIFRLVEIWPATRNPYDAFLSQQPLYEITTNSTQIVYGPAEPALIPGRKYAWQVQAKDVEGRDLFKNLGKSEVFVFQFGDALGAPEGLYLQTANPTSLVVRWEQNVAGTDAVKYRVRYRPHKGRAHDNWYEEESQEQWRALTQLQPETEYEVQVRAEQSVQVSEYGPVKVFKTALPGANEFVCKSDVTPPPAPTTNAPAVRLGINDTIHAGGYDVLVRELSENNNGVYTGSGMAIVPWFMSAKVRVTFKKINVNEQHWLTSGEIKSVWNPDSKFLVTPDKKPDPSTRPSNGEVPVTVAETETLIVIKDAIIVDVSKNEDGDIEVNTSDGETKKLEKGKSYSIVDAAGNGYIVDKEGNIAKTTAQEARDAAGRGNRDYTIALRFEKGTGVFGFDEKKYDALAFNYQQLEGGQYIPWKAVTSSRQDVVKAVLEGTDIDPRKVRFEVNGSPVTHSGFSGGISTVNVPGKAEGTVEELLAVYAPSDTGKINVLGKVNLTSYDQISRNLVIVPVNNAKLPGDPSDVTLSQELTKIYGQAVADWKVSIAPNPLKVTLDEYFDDGGSGLLSNYTDDMKKVINAFGTLQEKTYYLFLVEKPQSGKSALGYMPRSKQVGFIFSDNLTIANAIPTIAHELGHGAFNLKHIFSEYPLSKGATDNLMDYNNGTALYKYQWDDVHDPQTVIGLFEDDEDGESVVVYNYFPERFLDKESGTFTFLTPGGSYIVLPKEIAHVTFWHGVETKENMDWVTGTLGQFSLRRLENGKHVWDRFELKRVGNAFIYINQKTKEPYVDVMTSVTKINSFVMGLPGSSGFMLYKFKATEGELYNNNGNTLLTESDVSIRLFSAVEKQDAQSYEYKDNELVGGDQIQISNAELAIIGNYFEKPELVVLSKIGQLEHAYPFVYKTFTRNFNQWTSWMNALGNISVEFLTKGDAETYGDFDIQFYLDADLRALWDKEDKYDFYVRFLELLKIHIRKNADAATSFAAKVTKNSDRLSVLAAVAKLSQREMAALTAKDRLLLIAIIADGCMEETQEDLLLNLLRYQPRGQHNIMLQADSILTALMSPSPRNEKKILMDEIVYGGFGCGLDNETVFKGDNNYLELMGHVVSMCYSTKDFWDKVDLVNANPTKYVVDYHYKAFWGRVWNQLQGGQMGMFTPGYIKTSVDVNAQYKFTVHQDWYRGFIKQFPATEDAEYGPYDPVVLINESGLSLTNGFGYKSTKEYNEALKDKDRPVTVVPGLILRYIDDTADVTTACDAIMAAVDVATIWTGYGALMKGVTGLRRAFVIADMGSSALSIAGATATDPKVKAVLNGTSAVLGIFSVASSFQKESKQLADIYKAINPNATLTAGDVTNFAEAIKQAGKGALNTMEAEHVTKTKLALEIMVVEAHAAGKADLVTELKKAQAIIQDVTGVVKGVGVVTRLAGFTKKFANTTQSWLESLELKRVISFKSTGTNRWDVIFTYFRKGSDGVIEMTPVEAKIGEAFEEAGMMRLQADDLAGKGLESTRGDDILEFGNDIEFIDAHRNPQRGGAIVCKNGCGLDGTGCFAVGTPVYVSATKARPIESLVVGDNVLAYDSAQHRSVTSKVTQVITKGVTRLMKIFAKGQVITTTPNHPVYTTKGMMAAGALKRGLLMLTLAGGPLAVDSVASIDTVATVHNIEVAGVHTYYAGQLGVLVHNGDCFAKKYPRIQEFLNASSDVRDEFLRVFTHADDLADFEKSAGLLDAWKRLQQGGSAFVRNNPDYLKKFSKFSPEVQTRLASLPDAEAGSDLCKFLDDFGGASDAVIKSFDANLVDSWRYVKNLKQKSLLSIDIESLKVIKRQLDDADLMAKIGRERYDNIIKTYAGSCNVCPPPAASASDAVKSLPPHDQMLTNLEAFARRHSDKPNAQKVMAQLANGDARSQKGGEFLTRILKDEAGVTGFEFKYLDDLDNTADFMVSGVKADGKSWSVTGSINKIGGWELSDQLLEYIKNPPFEMWFDHSRFVKSGNSAYSGMDAIEAVEHIKLQYQKLFQNRANAEKLFNAITGNGLNRGKFAERFGVDNVDDFIDDVISEPTSDFYDFIKVK